MKSELPLRPIQKDSVKDRVYFELRNALMLGAFRPGMALTIPDLAETFGTSHMPVREALRRLVSEQALTTLSNRSVAVPTLTLERYEDLLRTRIVVEGTAAAWASASVSGDQLDNIKLLNGELNRQGRRSAKDRFLAAHLDFHFAVYRSAGSHVAMPIIEILWLQIGPYHNLMFEADEFQLGNHHHDELIHALERRDGKAARSAIERDLIMFADIIRPALKALAPKSST